MLLGRGVRVFKSTRFVGPVSIGLSSNILLARLATRHAKPAGSFHLTPDEVENFMAPLDVGELHNFGYATKKKIESTFKTSVCGELVNVSKGALQACLGEKNGQTLYNFVRGIDPRPLTPHQERRSVSAEVNVRANIRAACSCRSQMPFPLS
jgi:DNA repair protein REV1